MRSRCYFECQILISFTYFRTFWPFKSIDKLTYCWQSQLSKVQLQLSLQIWHRRSLWNLPCKFIQTEIQRNRLPSGVDYSPHLKHAHTTLICMRVQVLVLISVHPLPMQNKIDAFVICWICISQTKAGHMSFIMGSSVHTTTTHYGIMLGGTTGRSMRWWCSLHIKMHSIQNPQPPL